MSNLVMGWIALIGAIVFLVIAVFRLAYAIDKLRSRVTELEKHEL